MPSYMDVHDIPGVTAEDVAKAHEADVRVQGQYGVNYKQYWVDEADGKVFCLVDAPDKETATRSTARPTGWRPTRSTRSRQASSRSRSQTAAADQHKLLPVVGRCYRAPATTG